MRRVGRLHFRIAALAWIVVLAIMANSMMASAAPDARPVTTRPASTDAVARFIQSAQTLTINGSSAQSITILSTENVSIVSPQAGIAFFSDTACGVLNGTVGSPFSDSATNVREDWGSTFSVAPTSDVPSQIDDCHQVSIVDPTPTSVPTNTPVPTATPTNTPTNTPIPTSTSTPVPTPTLAPDQISINGSEASSVTAVSEGSIHIESASGWIAFYSDDACADLSGTERSPFDRASSLYIALYGTSFSVAGVTESSVPTTTCRQVSIIDPTPTPSSTPTMFMTINGSASEFVIVRYQPGSNDPVQFGMPEVPGGNITVHMFHGGCGQPEWTDVITRTFPGGGPFSLGGSYLRSFAPPGDGTLAVYAVRDTDGAQSACQMLAFQMDPPPGPATTPTPPPMIPTTPEPTHIPASAALVTDLPRTGSGSGTPPVFPTLILGLAMVLLVAPFSIERWRRHRKASR